MASNNYVTVDTILKSLSDSQANMPFSVTYDGTTIELMTTSDTLDHMSMLFGSWYWFPPFTNSASADTFKALFNSWCSRNASNIVRQVLALAEDYNPIFNYDLTEQSADGSRRSNVTDTVTPSGTMSVASAHTGTDTTTDDRYGLDSSAGAHADKSTLSHGETVTDTTSFNQYKTETVTSSANDQSVTLPDGSTGTGYDTGSEHYMRRFGNIGVQTAADILGGELEIRIHDIAVEWLERFRDRYFVYWG